MNEVVGEPDGERGACDNGPRDRRCQGRVANGAVGKGDDLREDVQFVRKFSFSSSSIFLDEQ